MRVGAPRPSLRVVWALHMLSLAALAYCFALARRLASAKQQTQNAKREQSMKAAFIESTGAPDVIQYGEVPQPTPREGEVLVKVGAVAVNPIDTYIRAGNVPMALPKPFIIGCDLAGTVAALGPGVKAFKVGDRVWGSNQGLLGRQ